MKLTRKDLLSIVKDKILSDNDFKEALEITRRNSSGKIWLIGGFLYKNLVDGLYGTCKKPAKDFDLIVERTNKQLILPDGWKRVTNTFGNPKLFNEENEIDFIPLKNIYYIKKNKLEPTINNYFKSVPFNIHYLIYDIFADGLSGKIGVRALEEKTVAVHNLEMAKYGAKKYHTTINKMIREKAEALGFKAEFS